MSPRRHGRSCGAAAVETALLLPLLVLLALPVADLARALQARLILDAISREGASLAARGTLPLKDASQAIMDTLAATAPPLDMRRDGMLFVSRIMGSASGPLVLEQHRWLGGGHDAAVAAAACAGWDAAGRCTQQARPVALDPEAAPEDGEVVHVFEAHYRFRPWFGALLPGLETDMHALTLF
jgi:Flp pilus assembly protein TadG